MLIKANLFSKQNKSIKSYTPTWDYTFQGNQIKKEILNKSDNSKKYINYNNYINNQYKCKCKIM